MQNRFFKIFFFTTLTVAALLTLILFTDDLLFPVGYWLSSLNSDQYSIGFLVFTPIALTIVSGLLSLPVSLAIHWFARKKAKDADAKPKSKTKFYFFYFTALLAVSLLVILFCLLRFTIGDRIIQVEYDAYAIALLFGTCVVEAMVLAALLVSVIALWKSNRMAAIILGIIILVALPANFISAEAIYSVSSEDYYDSYDYSPNYSLYDDVDVEAEAEVEEDYDHVIEVEEDYLSFLWNENDSISNAFSYLFKNNLSDWNSDYPGNFLSDICFKLYWIKESDFGNWMSDSDRRSEETFRKVYRYLKENTSEILSAFYSYQDIIYQYMPVEKFYNTAAANLVSYLYVAHQDLYGDDDLSRLENIHKLMTNIEHDDASDYYDDIKLHINKSYLPTFYSKDGELYQGGVVWAYSFWARRHTEGTDDIAYTIISALQSHSSDSEYYAEYYAGSDEYDDGDYNEAD